MQYKVNEWTRAKRGHPLCWLTAVFSKPILTSFSSWLLLTNMKQMAVRANQNTFVWDRGFFSSPSLAKFKLMEPQGFLVNILGASRFSFSDWIHIGTGGSKVADGLSPFLFLIFLKISAAVRNIHSKQLIPYNFRNVLVRKNQIHLPLLTSNIGNSIYAYSHPNGGEIFQTSL